MECNSYWAASFRQTQKRAELSGEKHTDVAIIGAGFTGLSSSYFLQKSGYQTIVLDQGPVGGGASGRNGSLMLVGYKHSLVNIANRFGVETAKEMLQISLDGIELVKSITQEHNIECELENNGSFYAAFKPAHFENLKREQEFMTEKLNYENTVVEANDIKQELDTNLYHGGLVDPNSYHFHPLKYAVGLGELVESVGGAIYENSKVISIDKKNQMFYLTTPNGKVVAKELVIATNGYTTSITKQLARSIIPMNSNMIATEPLDETIAKKLIPKKRGAFDTKNLLYYFRLSSDNRLLFGSRIAGPQNDILYEKLRQGMLNVFPQLKESKIDYKWGGKLAVTRSMFPHVGKMEDGAHFALGYSGHGVSLSTLMGQIIAENIAASDREKCSLEKLPLKEIPFLNQRGLILNLATNYFRLKDLIS
ncbi:FAD-binding oxidoreductase [Siminovitchia acidinfaciens]|uniref:FAD-binding oxidoreductase n=1 Tax=Siminovitchia acidinfaciens TaxID=2321395 RepID=A0A429Y789_9BACI|nr:FAD-binding oxidoreductase [Siminovitchia acidinfaciens]RST77290.1 FAD-binding oxidoreductase [Siminovitchia acidinfaciens]